MKKDHQSSIRRERMIMLASSVFVLGALTLSGVYMRNQTKQSQDDGYTIDFSALEERAEDKLKEITQNVPNLPKEEEQIARVPDADLDYFPLEAGSDEIKIPGLTDRLESRVVDDSRSDGMSEGAGKTAAGSKAGQGTQPAQPDAVEDKKDAQTNAAQGEESALTLKEGDAPGEEAVASDGPILSETLHFAPETMVRPVSGEVLIDYSMSGSVYFATLDQYKYNPAVIYAAAQGETVGACASGKVLDIRNDSELGHVMVLDLGDGYQAVYGQLEGIEVPIGGMVEPGMKVACVAAPTKYYSVEGSNLYFQILKDGVSVNPNLFFQN